MLTIGKHIVFRRGLGIGSQQFEAGNEINASLAQLATISGIPPVQRIRGPADQQPNPIQRQLWVRAAQ
jgi:hypothetical protein